MRHKKVVRDSWPDCIDALGHEVDVFGRGTPRRVAGAASDVHADGDAAGECDALAIDVWEETVQAVARGVWFMDT